MNENIYVNTKRGTVMGKSQGGFNVFKGIPYAVANRFECPQPVHWDGIRDCTSFGKKAMQVIDNTAPWAKEQTRDELDEDCLNLNIYVPDKKEKDAKQGLLPVLIEVHGGAFQNGSNQERTPEQMIRDHSFIYVPINYRLGIFGFLYLGFMAADSDDDYVKTSGNAGLMDIMAAVRWIYDNISAFGGDPDRITLMGSSAGAKAIGALLCRQDLKQYVHQVILSSGACQSIRSQKTAGEIAKRYLNELAKVTGKEVIGLNDLRTLSADTLIEAQKILCDNPGNTCMFGPVADGVFFPENIWSVAKKGTLWEGRAMIGSSFHELAFYKMMDPDFVKKAPRIAEALFGENSVIACGDFNRLMQEYREFRGCEPSGDDMADMWVRILTDYMYRTYSYRLAAALALKGCRVWQYSVSFLPALHCFDQQLAFSKPLALFFNGPDHMEKAEILGQEIYNSFIRFIEEGSPAAPNEWPSLSQNDPVQMIWDENSRICPVTENDVLQGIGDAVYQL